MHRLILTSLYGLCLVLWGLGALQAQHSSIFDEGNSAFKAGDFVKAADRYEKMISQGETSFSLFYNLGNSQFRLGENGRAILSYERAKLLSPRDPDLRANLALARKNVAVFDKERFNPWADAALTFLNRNEWSWLTTGAALWIGMVAILSGVLQQCSNSFLKLRFASVIASIMILLLGIIVLRLRREESQQGIVVAKEASVRLSPFDKAESIGAPGEGRKVQIGSKNAEFFFIQVPGTDLQGWMHRTEVERIEPSSLDGL